MWLAFCGVSCGDFPADTPPPLGTYCLVSSAWLSAWKAYVSGRLLFAPFCSLLFFVPSLTCVFAWVWVFPLSFLCADVAAKAPGPVDCSSLLCPHRKYPFLIAGCVYCHLCTPRLWLIL